jgi:hypothetical protein
VTHTVDIDFATRELYERIRNSSDFVTRVEQSRPNARLEGTVVIVPGAFYRTHPWTGADGHVIRDEAERLGATTEIIPLPNLAPLRQNARQICDWLRQCSAERVILVSLSKGSGDVKTALAEPDAGAAFARVVEWVNVSGALDGSPLVDWLLAGSLRSHWTRFLLWIRRHDAAAIRELAHRPGIPVMLPAHVRPIHVIGFPEKKNLSSAFALRCHRRLEHLGPNDGAGLLLTDALSWPGVVYPVWGADHYLRGMSAVARQVLSYLAETIRVQALA